MPNNHIYSYMKIILRPIVSWGNLSSVLLLGVIVNQSPGGPDGCVHLESSSVVTSTASTQGRQVNWEHSQFFQKENTQWKSTTILYFTVLKV